MLKERYQTDVAADYQSFEFVSVGPRGSVTKVVHYSATNLKGVFNLGFGDKDPITGYVSDISVTNNQDSQKVLATVAATLYAFTDIYPGANGHRHGQHRGPNPSVSDGNHQ